MTYRIEPALMAIVAIVALASSAEAAGAQPRAAPAPSASSTPSAASPSVPLDEKSVEEGRILFSRGVSLFRDGDYRAALLEFQRAQRAAPNYRIYYNIGQTCLELLDYPCALDALSLYLQQGGLEVPEARRGSVQAERTRLAQLVAKITIDVDAAGAEVLIDDLAVGKAPLPAPVVVGIGRHRIAARIANRDPQVRIVDVVGGVDKRIELRFPTILPRASEARETLAPSRAPFWVALALTGGAGVATGVMGGYTLTRQRGLDNALAQYPANSVDVDNARDSVKKAAIFSNILGASVAVAFVTTAVLWFATNPRSVRTSEPRNR
jgi:hypothetical protein